jgi:DNA recombination protein RmuC
MGPIWLLVGLLLGAGIGAWLGVRFGRTGVAGLWAQLEAAQTVSGARDELIALVKQGAGEELTERGDQFLKLMKAQLETAMTQAGADGDARKKAVEELVAPVGETLRQLGERLKDVDEARQRTETELTAQLRTVNSAQQQVARNASLLERALRQPHVRGRWGELGLQRLAEMTGMSELCDFEQQPHFNDDGRVLRPDMVVNLPEGHVVVVDSKVPLAAFLDAMEATDDAERVEKLKLFARAIRGHVRKLADKDYAAQLSTAPPFTVMYVPGDHFLTGALEVDGELMEDALRHGVHIATPASLLALLRTVAYIVQQAKAAEDAQEVVKLGRELYDRLRTLLSHIDKVSRCVNSLVSAQNDVVGSVERRVLVTGRKFAELGVAGPEEEFPEARSVTNTVRRVQADELPAAEVRELPPLAEEAA